LKNFFLIFKKRVKSATPLSDVNAEEMSSESEDDEFKVESSSKKKGGGKALVLFFDWLKQKSKILKVGI